MTGQPTPGPIFTTAESAELLDLIRASRMAHADYVRALSSRTSDEAVDKAQEADRTAASAVEQWVINRTDYSQSQK